MAIKQRALRKLNTTTNHMLRAMSTESKAAIGGVCQDLEELRDLYREGLPQQDYATYGEVCDGLLLAVQKMMEDGAADVSGDATALCKELLEYLGTETEKETHFKKEIVFLPYQASMWDSLESVWKAAYEDKEHCNAYVIPIPYADLNPDRSVAAWHCERDQFPKYVPTLDWQEVDLKAWHPDIIFYHNPYDNCNLVTSVESRYYSRNLKECADKLVYIPYFVLEEPCTEESVEHFVTTPGVLNPDQVIVQSEAMRELYINILTKRTNHTDRSFWENRISGAGSPKIEKVLTSKKEDFDMPEKWRKLVEGRKVILYNTSLGAMLQNSDKVCDKLRYVFDVFRNRDDVALWWRPHPLMKSTFHSMRPQFEEEYLSLEKQYIEEGWGIYDDSSDLHRAICYSDAYYGDESSVVMLYRKTGKLITYENFINIPYEDGRKQEGILVWPQDMIVGGNDLWIMHGKISVLFRYSLCDKCLKQVVFVPNKSMFCMAAYQGMHINDGRLFLLPYRGEEIAVYDIKHDSFQMLALPGNQSSQLVGLFQKSFSFGKYLYCVPVYYPFILKMDMETLEITVAFDQLSAVQTFSASAYVFNDACQIGDSCMAGVWSGTNLVLIYNMADDSHEIIRIGKNHSSYEQLDSYKDNLYLLDIKHHELTVFSIKTKSIKKMIRIPSTVSLIKSLGDGRLWLASHESGESYVLNSNTSNLEQLPLSVERHGSLNYFYKHSYVKILGDRLFIYDRRACEFSVFDKSGKVFHYKVDGIDVECQLEEILRKYRGKHAGEGSITEECGVVFLDNMMDMIVERKRNIRGQGKYIGKKIYEWTLQ